MTDALLGLVILLLLGVLALLAALWKRRGSPEVQEQLRAQAAGLAAQAEELRGQVAKLEARSRELEQQVSDEIGGRRTAEASLAAERKNLAEQRALLDEAGRKLKDAFAALSDDALKANRNEFLTQADQRLKPVQELLARYEKHLGEIEQIRADAYGGLKNHLESLAKAHDLLQREAHQLSTALRSPTVRGRWGEMTLRRVVEVAGMGDHCTFEEQASVTTEDGRLRPDMKIMLPGNRVIVVDSKVPLAAYMDAFEAKDEAARQAALARHAQDVRKHVQALKQKAYWEQIGHAADFVVLFLPGESFFSAALEQDRSLLEDAMANKVFLATPTTLMALLNVVAHGWRQQEMAENAEKIGAVGRELYERISKFMEHFARVGDGLTAAGKAYNAAAGSYESRVQPAARRLAEQAAVADKELPEVPRVEPPTRTVERPALEAPREDERK